MPYHRFLRRLHNACLFDWYLEVGCRSGESFAPVRSKTVAVDPFFRAEINIIGQKPALHVFQMTSDDFFASGFMARNGIRLSLAFLDGMHLFEFLLRDFIHTEAAMEPKGVILLHDCVPYGMEMTTRDLDNLPKGSWTGDVWKLIPILHRWRPELEVTVLDCRPTGLVCVSGLDPDNRVLVENHDAIVAEFSGVDLDGYGIGRFFDSFAMASAKAEQEAGFPRFLPASLPAEMALVPQPVTP
ncbi:class I SAM-dependent methyltransferase [Rhodobacter calidifons]|nr:class I SAM-dependent methyltransferase [Rhodobacter calidifons]